MYVNSVAPSLAFKGSDNNVARAAHTRPRASKALQAVLLGTLATAAGTGCPSADVDPSERPPVTVNPSPPATGGEAGTAGIGGNTGGVGGATTTAPVADTASSEFVKARKAAGFTISDVPKQETYTTTCYPTNTVKTLAASTDSSLAYEVRFQNANTNKIDPKVYKEVWAIENGNLTETDDIGGKSIVELHDDGRMYFYTSDGTHKLQFSWENTPSGVNVRDANGNITDLLTKFKDSATINDTFATKAEQVSKLLKQKTDGKKSNFAIAKQDTIKTKSNFAAIAKEQASAARARIVANTQAFASRVKTQARTFIANRRTAGVRSLRAIG